MRDNDHLDTMFDHPDFILLDAVSLEREARRLRAEAMAEGLRDLGRWIARQGAALRAGRAKQTA